MGDTPSTTASKSPLTDSDLGKITDILVGSGDPTEKREAAKALFPGDSQEEVIKRNYASKYVDCNYDPTNPQACVQRLNTLNQGDLAVSNPRAIRAQEIILKFSDYLKENNVPFDTNLVDGHMADSNKEIIKNNWQEFKKIASLTDEEIQDAENALNINFNVTPITGRGFVNGITSPGVRYTIALVPPLAGLALYAVKLPVSLPGIGSIDLSPARGLFVGTLNNDMDYKESLKDSPEGVRAGLVDLHAVIQASALLAANLEKSSLLSNPLPTVNQTQGVNLTGSMGQVVKYLLAPKADNGALRSLVGGGPDFEESESLISPANLAAGVIILGGVALSQWALDNNALQSYQAWLQVKMAELNPPLNSSNGTLAGTFNGMNAGAANDGTMTEKSADLGIARSGEKITGQVLKWLNVTDPLTLKLVPAAVALATTATELAVYENKISNDPAYAFGKNNNPAPNDYPSNNPNIIGTPTDKLNEGASIARRNTGIAFGLAGAQGVLASFGKNTDLMLRNDMFDFISNGTLIDAAQTGVLNLQNISSPQNQADQGLANDKQSSSSVVLLAEAPEWISAAYQGFGDAAACREAQNYLSPDCGNIAFRLALRGFDLYQAYQFKDAGGPEVQAQAWRNMGIYLGTLGLGLVVPNYVEKLVGPDMTALGNKIVLTPQAFISPSGNQMVGALLQFQLP